LKLVCRLEHTAPNKPFLYIDPLKQGLKLWVVFAEPSIFAGFLYIDPLKQGLKLNRSAHSLLPRAEFLYIDPLKQGLKPL